LVPFGAARSRSNLSSFLIRAAAYDGPGVMALLLCNRVAIEFRALSYIETGFLDQDLTRFTLTQANTAIWRARAGDLFCKEGCKKYSVVPRYLV
jgi:hypothetical protein